MSHGTVNVEPMGREGRRFDNERDDYRARRIAQAERRQERRGQRRAAAAGRLAAIAAAEPQEVDA